MCVLISHSSGPQDPEYLDKKCLNDSTITCTECLLDSEIHTVTVSGGGGRQTRPYYHTCINV